MSTLTEYRALVTNCERPSRRQREAFARFVSTAHSWYKRLPIHPPGSPFQFFLDPCAGMQFVSRSATHIEVEFRKEGGSHYSDMPTGKYRERFGSLGFSSSARTSIFFPRSDGAVAIPNHRHPLVLSRATGGLVELPAEVLDAGRVAVTCAIHTLQLPCRWVPASFGSETMEFSWPEESGGPDALRAIVERCSELKADSSCREEAPDEFQDEFNAEYDDYRLYQLLEPERLRQLREMVAAMERVLDLLER